MPIKPRSFHPQIGGSWSKEVPLITESVVLEQISCFHPQIGGSWSKADLPKNCWKRQVRRFPSPDWGELIERKRRLFFLDFSLEAFAAVDVSIPRLGGELIESPHTKGKFLKCNQFKFPSPDWGGVDRKEYLLKYIQENFHVVSIPRLGGSWSKVREKGFEDTDSEERFHPQIGGSWSKDGEYQQWYFPEKCFHPQIGGSWSKAN